MLSMSHNLFMINLFTRFLKFKDFFFKIRNCNASSIVTFLLFENNMEIVFHTLFSQRFTLKICLIPDRHKSHK